MLEPRTEVWTNAKCIMNLSICHAYHFLWGANPGGESENFDLETVKITENVLKERDKRKEVTADKTGITPPPSLTKQGRIVHRSGLNLKNKNN